jgi:hypothetical protein
MYIVAPGKQYQLQDYQAFDHTLIISALPKEDKEAEYDVWWALVLDPSLEANFQDEHELILAAQGRFAPSKNFDVKETPSYAFLRRFLNVQNNVDLEEYFRPDRTLPRVLIIPAKFALRARVESVPQPETPVTPTTPAAESGAQPESGSDRSSKSAEPAPSSPAENSPAPAKPEAPRL